MSMQTPQHMFLNIFEKGEGHSQQEYCLFLRPPIESYKKGGGAEYCIEYL
jgi:hypothetical protein